MNIRSLQVFLSILGVSSLISACSTDSIQSNQVDPDTIYQQYSVQVDETESALDFSATLRVGGITGTTVALADPAKIEFDGQSTQQKQSLGTRYQLKAAISDSSDLTYDVVYIDQSGSTYQNTLVVNPIRIADLPESIVVGDDLMMRLSSTVPFMDGETVTIVIAQESSSDTTSNSVIHVEKLTKGDSIAIITIPASEVANLDSKKRASIQVTREYFQALKNVTSKGGASLNTYRVLLKNVIVE